MSIAAPTSVLFAYKAGSSLRHATFSRSSSATYRDRTGVLQTASSGVPRTEWTDPDGDENFEQETALIEGSRTNSLTRSEELDHADWSTAGTPVVTANDASAPDGNTTAERIEDDNSGAFERVEQGVTVSDDSTEWTFSCFMKRGSTARVSTLVLEFEGGSTTLFYAVDIDLSDGTVGASPNDDTPTNQGAEAWGDGWYRVWVTGPNNSTGNTTCTVGLHPSRTATVGGSISSSETGEALFWGAQLENDIDMSSYIATTSSTASRAAEELTLPYNFGTGDMTLYARIVRPRWAGLTSATVGFRRAITIGTNTSGSATNPVIRLATNQGDQLRAQIVDAGGSQSDSDAAIPSGDPIEYIGQFRNLGSGPQSRIDVGSGLSAWAGAVNRIDDFGDTELAVGTEGAELFGNIIVLKVISGLVSLDSARNIRTPVDR